MAEWGSQSAIHLVPETVALKHTRRLHLPSPTPVRRTNLTALILEQLRQYVIQHDLREEDRLPPERELAIRLQVSRPSLRNALDWLSHQKALRRVQGGGTFLAANFLSVVAQYNHRGGSEAPSLAELAEARSRIEPVLAEMAAVRATQAELAELTQEVDRAQSYIDRADAWHQFDLQFHTRVGRMARNGVFAQAMEDVLAQVLAFWTTHADECDRVQAQADHRRIAEALNRRDDAAAARAMLDHLRLFERAVVARPLKLPA